MITKKQFQDKQKRVYTHFEVDGNKTAVLSLGSSNMQYNGNFKIVKRVGESKFGNEYLFEFKIKNIEKTYDTDSPHDCFEIYLTEEEAKALLKEVMEGEK